MQDHTAESVKSLEGFRVAWIEEAHTLSRRSLKLLRPTIRADGSEIRASWNPRRKNDAIDELLRGAGRPSNAIVVRANWSDNPWFPRELDQERQDDLRDRPDQYEHIWEGDYEKVTVGAYYAESLIRAKQDGRIGRVGADPLMATYAIFDIGGTGAKADAVAIWIAQFVGREIRVLDYYEAVGQPLATHLAWMRSRGYVKGKVEVILPHDGATQDKVYAVSYESAITDAGYSVRVIPNQGKGAAAIRIEARGGSSRASGSTRRRPKPAATPSATTTNARTRPGTSASAPSTTGHRTAPTPSA
jgi:phage terminase large subunit